MLVSEPLSNSRWQMLCLLTLRSYRTYLLDHHISQNEELGLRKSHMDSYEYKPESTYSAGHSYEGPEVKYDEKSYQIKSSPDVSSPDVQTEYYKSRPQLYSKISHKNDLRRKSLAVPTTAPGKKSPTLERMDYETFKGRRRSSNVVPLERDSSIRNHPAENRNPSKQDLGDDEATGLLHDDS
jgi:hypothetical protein